MERQLKREPLCSSFGALRHLTRTVVWSIALSAIVAGCVAHKPPSTIEPPGVVKSVAADSAPITPSISSTLYQPGELHYDLQIFSVVQAFGGDSTHRADSSRIGGIITTSFTTGPERNVVTARVQSDSLSLTAGSGTSVPLPNTGQFVFAIDTRTGHIMPNSQEMLQDCSQAGPESSPLYGREVIPAIRSKVDVWNDTLQSSACRGGVVLSVRRIVSYKQSADSTLRLFRSTQFHITGSGHQWGQKIEVSGEGTSRDTLRMGGSPLRIQGVVGSSQATFVFRSPLRTQEFTQTTTTRIALRRR